MDLKPIGGNIWKRSSKSSSAPEDYLEIRNIVEALLFVSDEPLSVKKIKEVVEAGEDVVSDALADLRQELLEDNRGIQLREIGDGWKLHSHPAYADYIQRLMLSERRGRLTRAALETLAIIAYMQPITRAQIAAIRGIQSESVVKVLEGYHMVRETGKESAPGGPALYETTPEFLEQFGLKTIEDLPPLEGFEPDEATIEQIKRSLLPPGEPGATEAAAIEMDGEEQASMGPARESPEDLESDEESLPEADALPEEGEGPEGLDGGGGPG